jgi:catechol 2,3-dioxygenase-like lactoylglutathione lyase family enzyme
MVATAQLKLASVVMFVTDLDRSVKFYSELLDLEPTIRNDTAALLVSSGGCQVYLRCIGTKGTHTLGAVGPQYVLWSAESEADLDRCESLLRAQSNRVSMTQHDGFRMLEGRDPDDEPVIVSYPGPDKLPRHEIVSRIYGW